MQGGTNLVVMMNIYYVVLDDDNEKEDREKTRFGRVISGISKLPLIYQNHTKLPQISAPPSPSEKIIGRPW